MKNISLCIIILSICSFIPTYSSIKTRLHAYQNPLPKWKDSDNIIESKKRIFEVSPDPSIVKVIFVGDIIYVVCILRSKMTSCLLQKIIGF